jgi:hypothetical protein
VSTLVQSERGRANLLFMPLRFPPPRYALAGNNRCAKRKRYADGAPDWPTLRGAMTEPEDIVSDLPELDRTDDPRGAAVAWALLAVAALLVVAIIFGINLI